MKVLLVLAALVGVSYGQMKCLFCEGVSDIADCQTNTVDCGASERCFLEKVTTKNLNFVYNAGCRSSAVCSIMQTLANAGRKRDLVNCAQCCSTTDPNDPCNGHLCGAGANLTASSTCVFCDRLVSGASSCSERQVCQDTEICKSAIHIVGGLIRYEFGCESTHLCKAFLDNDEVTTTVVPPGRRSSIEHEGITICSACCRGKDCNREDCYATHAKMTPDNIMPPSAAPSG